jgi:hypothetical protein
VGEELGAHSGVVGRVTERQERVVERWGAAALNGRHRGNSVEHAAGVNVGKVGC